MLDKREQVQSKTGTTSVVLKCVTDVSIPVMVCCAFHRGCAMTYPRRLTVYLFIILLAGSVFAESKDPGDYPLRVHIFSSTGTTFYRYRVPDEARGQGRANVFENGEPRGIDFSYDCTKKVEPSFQFETYPAKWKKKDAELVLLLPVIGKAGAYFTCTLKTNLKEYAYFMNGGRLDSEPPAKFKAWMAEHQYDPEHGKNTPTGSVSSRAFAPIDEARQLLTGVNKDTERARNLLLPLVQNSGNENPQTVVWAAIYLGYIEDRANNRQAAIGWYDKASHVEGASAGSLNLAKFGLHQPLIWIRHLDSPQGQGQ
jgi:hypothetical protein